MRKISISVRTFFIKCIILSCTCKLKYFCEHLVCFEWCFRTWSTSTWSVRSDGPRWRRSTRAAWTGRRPWTRRAEGLPEVDLGSAERRHCRTRTPFACSPPTTDRHSQSNCKYLHTHKKQKLMKMTTADFTTWRRLRAAAITRTSHEL